MNNLEDISWEFECVAMYLLITSLCIFHSSFWQNFSNMIISSINYFCSYTIGTLLNIEKLHVSKYLQSCHITINKFYCQWEPHKLFTLKVLWMFINNIACCFFSCFLYFTNEKWVSQILSLYVFMISFSMLIQLQLLIDILEVLGHVLISLTTWNKVYI